MKVVCINNSGVVDLTQGKIYEASVVSGMFDGHKYYDIINDKGIHIPYMRYRFQDLGYIRCKIIDKILK